MIMLEQVMSLMRKGVPLHEASPFCEVKKFFDHHNLFVVSSHLFRSCLGICLFHVSLNEKMNDIGSLVMKQGHS